MRILITIAILVGMSGCSDVGRYQTTQVNARGLMIQTDTKTGAVRVCSPDPDIEIVWCNKEWVSPAEAK